jgi:hypothetical protein
MRFREQAIGGRDVVGVDAGIEAQVRPWKADDLAQRVEVAE